MADVYLLFGAFFAFGFLIGFAAGDAKGKGIGVALVTGLLAGGFIVQAATMVALALDIDSAMAGLLAFSLGGFAGLLAGLLVRKKGWLPPITAVSMQDEAVVDETENARLRALDESKRP